MHRKHNIKAQDVCSNLHCPQDRHCDQNVNHEISFVTSVKISEDTLYDNSPNKRKWAVKKSIKLVKHSSKTPPPLQHPIWIFLLFQALDTFFDAV